MNRIARAFVDVRMQRSTIRYFGAALFLSVAAACSSSSSSDAPATNDQDAGDPGDVDGGDTGDSGPARVTKVGAVCTKDGFCSPGQSCMGISQHGGEAICMQTCKGAGDCPGTQQCTNKICQPTCSGNGCPGAMDCVTDIDECIFDCDHNPALCGPNEQCSQSIQCIDKVPDAGPLFCKSGGGTATSGITGSKTVGSLNSTEQATFCDWAAGVTGGYGCQGACDGGLGVTFSASQSACISQFTKSGCAATVSDVEACVKENAQDVCALDVLHSATCASLRACM